MPLTQKKSEDSLISVTAQSAVSMPCYPCFENPISCPNKQDKADLLNLQAMKALIRYVFKDTHAKIGTEDLFWGKFLVLQPKKLCSSLNMQIKAAWD